MERVEARFNIDMRQITSQSPFFCYRLHADFFSSAGQMGGLEGISAYQGNEKLVPGCPGRSVR